MARHLAPSRRPRAVAAAAVSLALLMLAAVLVAPGATGQRPSASATGAAGPDQAARPGGGEERLPLRLAATGTGTIPARLAWFYKPPTSTYTSTVVANFDTFVLSKGDESFRDRLRSGRSWVRVRQYFLLSQILKPASGQVEQRNQAAYMPGDFERLWRDHRDWFLKKPDGTPVIENGYYRMDPGNQGWRDFWISRVRAANGGWDGVFADNTDLSRCGFDREGITLAKYSTDAAYTDAIAGFLKQIHERYHLATGKPFVANLVNGCTGRDARAKYHPYIQGYMDEGWGVDWGSGYWSATRWRQQVDRAAKQAALGKQVILVSQGARTATARQRFAFASYLLVAGPRISFRYTNARESGSYREAWMYDNYNARLGTPLGIRYQTGGGWRRNFTHGYVLVNPTTHSSKIVVY